MASPWKWNQQESLSRHSIVFQWLPLDIPQPTTHFLPPTVTPLKCDSNGGGAWGTPNDRTSLSKGKQDSGQLIKMEFTFMCLVANSPALHSARCHSFLHARRVLSDPCISNGNVKQSLVLSCTCWQIIPHLVITIITWSECRSRSGERKCFRQDC